MNSLVLLLALFTALPNDAVVSTDCCSGVCINDEGYILTAKHCQVPEEIEVVFFNTNKRVKAKRIYVSDELDGPVILDCEGRGYPFVDVSKEAPKVNDLCTVYGKNFQNGTLFKRDCKLVTGSIVTEKVGPPSNTNRSYKTNLVDVEFMLGVSGGPLLNSKNEVIGLAATTPSKTIPGYVGRVLHQELFDSGKGGCISWGAIDFALKQVSYKSTEKPEVSKEAPKPPEDLSPIPLIQEEAPPPPPKEEAPPAPKTPEVVETPKAPETPETTKTVEPPKEEVKVPEPPKTVEPEKKTTPEPKLVDKVEKISGILGTGLSLWQILAGGALTIGTGGLGGLGWYGAASLAKSLGKRALTKVTNKKIEESVIPEIDKRSDVNIKEINRLEEIIRQYQKQEPITNESPPPPQVVVRETKYAPYERDSFSEAYSYAKKEMCGRYPGSVGTFETADSLINQYLSSKGISTK